MAFPGYPFPSKTIYKYITPNGGPPNAGAPPKAPGPPPGPPPMYGFAPPYTGAGAPPSMVCYPTAPPPPQPHTFCFPVPPQSCCVPPPQAYNTCRFVYVPPAGPAPVPQFVPALQPQLQQYFTPTNPTTPVAMADLLPPGSRVNGRYLKLGAGDVGYVANKENCSFLIIQNGVKPWLPGQSQKEIIFTPYLVSVTMKFAEFLEQIGAYGKYASDTPQHHVGVTQVYYAQGGVWTKGSTILYGDPRSNLTLQELGWTKDHGEVGKYPPVILAFEP